MKVDAKKVFKLQEGLIMSKIEINDSGGGEIDWRYILLHMEKRKHYLRDITVMMSTNYQI
jgi:hypothetical protein